MVSYANIDVATTACTATASIICKHNNGWYTTIKFWIFWRKIFMCSDCGECLTGKRLKQLRMRSKQW